MSDKVSSVSSKNNSVVEKMMKRSKHGKSSKSSKSGRSKSSKLEVSSSNGNSKSSGILSTIMNFYHQNPKIVWGTVVVITLAAIWYYNNQKAKQLEEEQEKLRIENENKQKLEHYENLMKNLEEEHKNGIVKIKLPERFLQDENGRPIVLTPDILQDIQSKAQPSKKQTIESEESEESSDDDDDDDDLDDVPKMPNQAMDNEIPNTEEFVEEKDLKQQDLTNDEMDQIRQQLEMMNKSNNIVASNS